MNEIHIVEGDLESFAKTVGGIPGERLNSVDGETILREATVGMPGSESKVHAGDYGAALERECKKVAATLTEMESDVMTIAMTYHHADEHTAAAWRRLSRDPASEAGTGVPGVDRRGGRLVHGGGDR